LIKSGKKTVKATQPKNSYTPPKLTTYGELRNITTGGSGKNVESNPGGPKHHSKA
jgi:hypothetical protein